MIERATSPAGFFAALLARWPKCDSRTAFHQKIGQAQASSIRHTGAWCCCRKIGSAQRKEANLTFPLTVLAALGDEQKILDGVAGGEIRAHFKDAGHRQSGADSIFGEPSQRCHVVSQDHSLFTRGPGKQVGVIDSRQINVLDAEQIQCGPPGGAGREQ